MIGAIIGDLAADLWQRDKMKFYRQLVDDNAELSVYGRFAYELTPYLIEHKELCHDIIAQHIEDKVFSENHYHVRSLLSLVLFGICGWTNQIYEEALQQSKLIHDVMGVEKEEAYACHTLPILICSLRRGLSKKDALNNLDELFRNTFLQWPLEDDSPLGAIHRAWDAFSRAFDFTSTIHSAVKSPVNPRLTATIAGLLAQAMYGCEKGFLKKKYSDEPVFRIELPEGLNCFQMADYIESVRMFYPKNRARTNVELHTWTTIPNVYGHIHFDEELYKKIRMAMDTGWDNRYGIYLDDGWFYVYRSYIVLFRFQIAEMEMGYKISKIQRCEDPHADSLIALSEAFYSIECPPYTPHDKAPVLVPLT